MYNQKEKKEKKKEKKLKKKKKKKKRTATAKHPQMDLTHTRPGGVRWPVATALVGV
jgi:hypothetical protein